jgi:hypothetical protein
MTFGAAPASRSVMRTVDEACEVFAFGDTPR